MCNCTAKTRPAYIWHMKQLYGTVSREKHDLKFGHLIKILQTHFRSANARASHSPTKNRHLLKHWRDGESSSVSRTVWLYADAKPLCIFIKSRGTVPLSSDFYVKRGIVEALKSDTRKVFQITALLDFMNLWLPNLRHDFPNVFYRGLRSWGFSLVSYRT